MAEKQIAQMLSGGDRRSIGRANAVAGRAVKNPRGFSELIRCLWSDDPIVRMRAADAAEKASARNPALLKPFKKELLGLLGEATEQELRWHLAQMIPRLELSGKERQNVTDKLSEYLNDRSSIVKTFAIQGLADLAQSDPDLRTDVRALIEGRVRTGTPAVRARCRKLLKEWGARPC
jgi:hypothetical protein